MLAGLNAELMTTTTRCLLLAIAIQGLLLGFDEWVLHRQREMPKWERWGHPVDTFFLSLPFLMAGFSPLNMSKEIFVVMAILSCLIVLKDEKVHAGRITASESFLHGGLFLMHPVTLYWGYQNYIEGHHFILQSVGLLLFSVMVFQVLFWNVIEPKLVSKR